MIIAIEGHDGVGKTTLAKKLANELNFKYVKHPACKLMNISKSQYLNITENIIKYNSSILTAMFLSIGDNYVLHKYNKTNIILDRHSLLNYFWNGNKTSEYVFINSIKNFGRPDLTILLLATPEVRKSRLIKRDVKDKDLTNETILQADEKKLIKYLKRYKYNHIIIDTSLLTEIEVFKIAKKLIKQNLHI